MKKYIPILKRIQLFSGIGDDEITAMLSCLNARLYTFKKGEYVLQQGEYSNDIAVLTEGALLIQNDDYWGNRSILSRLSVGEMFGEAYALRENNILLNDVIAVEDSVVIFLT